MDLLDRIVTILVTATLTSAAWIVFGGSLIENATAESQRAATRPAEAVASPTPTPTVLAESDEDEDTSAVALAEREEAVLLKENLPRQYDEDEARNLMIPVLNVRPEDLTDTYTQTRAGGRLHEAIDIMAPEGTTVRAAAPGTIERIFQSKAGGNTIYIRTPDKTSIHYYAHLGEYAKGLKEGQRIRRGQRLGTVGSTGNADPDAPHLHFEIMRISPDAEWWEPAVSINPYPLLATTD